MSKMGIRRLTTELRILNPGSKFKYYDYMGVFGVIYTNTPASKLLLPEGYYFRNKNTSISNKKLNSCEMSESFDFEYDPEIFGETVKKGFWEHFLAFYPLS